MRFHAITILTLTVAGAVVAAQTPPLPVPQPFPGAGSPRPSQTAPPPEPAPPAATAPPRASQTPTPSPAPTAAPPLPAGVPVYPTAEYIGTFDAGAGQQYVLYGIQQPYADIVTYYKTVLKSGGREIFRAPMPPTHQFDLGRYNADRMAFPPSVVVKDYTWNNSPGYLHVVGTAEKRFPTVVQIVAPGPTP